MQTSMKVNTHITSAPINFVDVPEILGDFPSAAEFLIEEGNLRAFEVVLFPLIIHLLDHHSDKV